MPFLEVGVLPVSASLCYFYVRGGFIENPVKPSSELRLQCDQGAGSLGSPMECWSETCCTGLLLELILWKPERLVVVLQL